MPKSKNIEDYFPMGIDELIPDETVPFNVHLYFSQNRHVMLWKGEGEFIPEAFLEKYKSRGITKLWVHSDDAEKYQLYLNPPASAPETATPPVPVREITQAMVRTMKNEKLEEQAVIKEVSNLAQELLRRSVEPETQKAQAKSNEKIRDAISELLNDMLDGTRDAARKQLAEIWRIAHIDPDFEHAVNVSTFAVIFSMAFGRIDTDLLADMALAGLLHDIGLSQIPSGLAAIPWKEMDAAQLSTYALHVDLGVLFIQEHGKDVPERVREIISQHHEKFNGSGYPRRLQGFKVNDISQLLAIADILDSFSSGHWDGKRRTLRETFDMLEHLETTTTFPEYFNPDVFAAVIGWIHSTRSRDARNSAVSLVENQTRHIIQGLENEESSEPHHST